MKQNIDSKIRILSGNQLIVEGALEAGISLYTGYPGSPLADYFNILYEKKEELKQKGIRVAIANSEANAAAMASGAKQAGRDSIVAMKSMGLNVASDALSVGNFSNPGPTFRNDKGEDCCAAVVIVVGDDPWSISTSAPVDSRFLFKHLHIPFLSPATPQELKDWILKAKEISSRSSLYCGLVLTTYLAEGGGRVECFPHAVVNGQVASIDTSSFDLAKSVMVPPNSIKADRSMVLNRFPQLKRILEELDLDREWIAPYHSDMGFITSGPELETLKNVLEDHHLLEKFSLFQVATPYPLNEQKVVNFLSRHKKIVVVEEKRGFLEQEILTLIQKYHLDIEVYGKNFKEEEGFPAHSGLNYDLIKNKLEQLFSLLSIDASSFHCGQHEVLPFENLTPLPLRLPTFCPGCPHRETLSLLKDLRQQLKKEGVDLVSHGDVGCYSLSFLPPFKEMHNLSAMGQGGALGAGMDLFTDHKKNPSVVLMGDSTFFHSGLTDISNSVQLGHDITYILLDNDNTAMTGHQMTPRTGESVEGVTRPKQSLSQVAQALGVGKVLEVNPSDRYFYQNILRETIKEKGVKVIISNKECALTFGARVKKEERELFKKGKTLPTKTFFQINSMACEDCRECVEMTGCPGLTRFFDAYGTKVAIDPQICVADSYCTKLKVCPSFEKVTVFNYHPDIYQSKKEENRSLPWPFVSSSLEQIASGKIWRAVVTGVGGSGITTISGILANAALGMEGHNDLEFKFVDQKGLAQRNGNVTSYLTLYPKGKSVSPVPGKGQAQLVCSPDLLDGSRFFDLKNPMGEVILGDDLQWPLSCLLDNHEDTPPITREDLLKKAKAHGALTFGLRQKVEENLGKSVYQSTALLGAAYQRGLIPFSYLHLIEAIKKSVTESEGQNNLKAFELGRALVLDEGQVVLSENRDLELTLQNWWDSLSDSFLFWEKKFQSEAFSFFEFLKENFAFIPLDHLAQMTHDIFLFDRGEKKIQIQDDIKKIKSIYHLEFQELALRVLIKSYFIKDEVFVAHLMVSPWRKKNDKFYLKYGTHIKKVFLNRPSFDLGKRKIEFDLSPSVWMLKVMRHQRWIRRALPAWHSQERAISKEIRNKLLRGLSGDIYRQLKELDNIKGYRHIRIQKAKAKGMAHA